MRLSGVIAVYRVVIIGGIVLADSPYQTDMLRLVSEDIVDTAGYITIAPIVWHKSYRCMDIVVAAGAF